jgi:tryptophan synthase beta chain
MACYVLEDEEGKPAAVHSIASGLDYPGVGPQHSYLKDLGRASYESATDTETLEAFMMLSRVEGTSCFFGGGRESVSGGERREEGLTHTRDVLLLITRRH